MPWITFERDYDWAPGGYGRRSIIAFKRGMVMFVKRETAVSAFRDKAGRQSTEIEIAKARDAHRRIA